MNNETNAEKVGDYNYKEITGEEFCTYFHNLSKKLVKLTNETECHNGFQFVTGLNEDSIPFNPTGECEPGGIYFTDTDNIAHWLKYGGIKMKYCRTVTLKPYSRVYIAYNKFKSDVIELGERVEIKDLPCWSDNDYCLNAVKENISSFKYVRDINHYVQLEAIKHDALYTIRYLLDNNMEVTKEIQMEAINNNSCVIEYLLDHNIDIPKEVQIETVKQNSHVISRLLEKKVDVSEEVKLEAVKKDWYAIMYMLEHKVHVSKEVYIEAIGAKPKVLEFLLHLKYINSLDEVPKEVLLYVLNIATN